MADPHRIHPKPREKGAAHTAVKHERRHRSMEGRSGSVGSGATLSDVNIDNSSGASIPPGIELTPDGLFAYDANGNITMEILTADGSVLVAGSGKIIGANIQTSSQSFPGIDLNPLGLTATNVLGVTTLFISANDGSVTISGTGMFTGSTVRTSANYPYVIMDPLGLRAYNYLGVNTFNMAALDGSVTVNQGTITGATVQTSNTQNARVVMDTLGIHAYDATGKRQVNIDSATGLITCTGVISNLPGSTVPWQTSGFFVGGGNLVSNSSAEDPTSTTQILYFTTGSGVTAGTFTLQYGSNTVTSALNYNSTAAQVQTALNASGVLPGGVSASCSGGPLPGNAITINLAGTPSASPLVLSAASSLTGGSAVVGAIPIGWTESVGAWETISYSSAFHGGHVFRLTATANGSTPAAYQQIGPVAWVPGTTIYTLSTYFQAPVAARKAALAIYWVDVLGNQVAVTSIQSSWTTTPSWQRLVVTGAVPNAATRQRIAVTGNPTGGGFTLVYNGQTTASIPFNATAAQVKSIIEGLTNPGPAGTGFVTGGPLPNTPIDITFVFTPVAPTTMTVGTNSLSGGTSPNANVTNLPAVSANVTPSIPSANASEVYYVDAIQFECGDAPTAYAPRADEILANTVVANMINVAQLSAISANLGTVTAGTITGALMQTGAANPRVVFDSFGIRAYDSGGNNTVYINGSDGSITVTKGTITGATINITAYEGPTFAPGNTNALNFIRPSTNGVQLSLVAGVYSSSPTITELDINTYAATSVDRSITQISSMDNAGNIYAQLGVMQTGQGGSFTRVSAVVNGGIAKLLNFDATATFPGTVFAPAFTVSCSRALKYNWHRPDLEATLAKIKYLDVQEYEHRFVPGVRSLGPTAEDFREKFGLGGDIRVDDPEPLEFEKYPMLSLADISGVGLLGIQALVARIERERSGWLKVLRALLGAPTFQQAKEDILREALSQAEQDYFDSTLRAAGKPADSPEALESGEEWSRLQLLKEAST